MAEEEVVVDAAAAASPAPPDHKRKLEDLEPEAPERAEMDGAVAAEVGDSVANDESDAKRPRVENQDDDLGTSNVESYGKKGLVQFRVSAMFAYSWLFGLFLCVSCCEMVVSADLLLGLDKMDKK